MDGRNWRRMAIAAGLLSALAALTNIMPLGASSCGGPTAQGRVGTIVSSTLFPGTKMFLQCCPAHEKTGFSAPFEATPGLNGGPVIFVDISLALGSPDSHLDQPVLGRSWEQDVMAQLLAAVWSACGSNEPLSSRELSMSVSQSHKEALSRAQETGVGEVITDPENIYYPFDRTFCFANKAVEKKGWKPGTGSVCIDVIRAAYRPEFTSRTLSENSVVISAAIPGPTIRDKEGNERIATFEERLETVEQVAEILMEAIFFYNTEIASRIPELPVIEVLRLAPVPVVEEPPLPEREGDSEESQSSTFFSVPDDMLIEGPAEALGLSRAMLRGLSKKYRELRDVFTSDCRLRDRAEVSGVETVSESVGVSPADRLAEMRRISDKLREGPPVVRFVTSQPLMRCVRFPLPILDLAHSDGDIYPQALKAEEAATLSQE